MSTRSTIVLEQDDGTYKTIYSHWNGYPDWNGDILLHHYQDEKKVARLLDQGDISILRQNVGEKHNFDDHGDDAPAEKNNWTTFYKRDRGEEEVDAVTFKTLLEAINIDNWSDYIYVFKFPAPDAKKRQWFFTGTDSPQKLEDLKLLTEDDVNKS